MELVGLEPTTSWVRSTHSLEREPIALQDLPAESLDCRNIARNKMHLAL